MNSPQSGVTRRSPLLSLYGCAWTFAGPVLPLFLPRLRPGWKQRLGLGPGPSPARVWIQAASGGEAYLALEILRAVSAQDLTDIMVTTCTEQGLEILRSGLGSESWADRVQIRFFPFDRPGLVQSIIRSAGVELVILLETEIWPGLLFACRVCNVPVWVVNARMTESSRRGYTRCPALFARNAPHRVLAVSDVDAQRFASVFPGADIQRMENIKFDRMHPGPETQGDGEPWCASETDFFVFGSIRREEERRLACVLPKIFDAHPQVVTGLFPRHLERVDFWERTLKKQGLRVKRLSRLDAPCPAGTVLLGDLFGRLQEAYARADWVFVGGSLAPCGGQNFLEPLAHGVRPVIGPHWDNFYWVGEEIFAQGLVDRIRECAELIDVPARPPQDREEVRSRAWEYVRARQGGTGKVAADMQEFLDTAPWA